MCASSPGLGQRSLPKQQADINTYTLKSKEMQSAIAAFMQILRSCYGPTGRPKIIQNSSGAYVTTTSASNQLLQNLTVSKPVLKLMVAAVQGHLSRFSDSGLYCGLIMSYLVNTCIKLDLHPVLCININEYMIQECLIILDSIKIPVNVSDMGTMLCIVCSVIGSKPLCNLTAKELDHLSTLVLEAFLKTIPSVESTETMNLSCVECVTVEGVPPCNSCIYDGVLLDMAKFLSGPVQNMPMVRTKGSKHHGYIRVALYDISMSGDSDNFADVKYETSPDVKAGEVVLSQMLTMADKLVADEVGLVACQKVIHPTVKKYLKVRGVWTLDRLSRLHIDAVQRVTGAKILSTLNPDLHNEAYGYLEDIQVIEKFHKKYLHLTNASHPACTLLLCSRTQASLEELKNVCSAANQTLALLLIDPTVLPGAGCTETYMASQLRKMMTTIKTSVLKELGCTRAQYLTVANNFVSCFDSIATALEHDGGKQTIFGQHRYSLPPGVDKESDWLARYDKCACGMISFRTVDGIGDQVIVGLDQKDEGLDSDSVNDTESLTSVDRPRKVTPKSDTGDATIAAYQSGRAKVLDCYRSKQNALRVAMETASMVLRIKHTIEDTN